MDDRNESLSVGFAPIARLAYLGLSLAMIYVIGDLSFGWSLGETRKFSTLAIGPEYAQSFSILVQFGPNVFFLLTSLVKNGLVRNMFYLIALVLNGVDMATNLGAYTIYREQNPVEMAATVPLLADMANGIGWILCIIVTWGEEGIIYLVGQVFQILANIYEDRGRVPPAWFRADIARISNAASGLTGLQDMRDSVRSGYQDDEDDYRESYQLGRERER